MIEFILPIGEPSRTASLAMDGTDDEKGSGNNVGTVGDILTLLTIQF